MNENNMLPTALATEVLKKLHQIIDKKFKRSDRSKKVNPVLLKAKMTLFTLADEFSDKDPGELQKLLKELVDKGSIVTNLNNEGVYPFDAYFIPKTELIDEELFKIYLHVKSQLNCS